MDIEEGKQQMLQAPALELQHNIHANHEEQWLIMEEGDEYDDDIYNTSSSFDNSSTTTNGSTSSSSEVVDDASSPTSTLSSSTNSTSPLYELSELMAHLPIKRGLSNFYQGKSQSFTTLSRVASIEDLPKKEITPYTRKMKASKSYANSLDSYKPYTLRKAIISKKVSRSCLSFPSRRGSFLTSSRPPLAPIQKKF